jgi:hypothetical protein
MLVFQHISTVFFLSLFVESVKPLVEEKLNRYSRKSCGSCCQQTSGDTHEEPYPEFPVFFALATSQPSVFQFLIEQKRDLLRQVDSWGNSVLHWCVMLSLPQMYEVILTLSQHASNLGNNLSSIRNKQGFTPMTLAAQHGSLEMLQTIIDSQREREWEYGNRSSHLYLLDDELDPLPHETIHQGGVLNIIIENGHSNLLKIPIIHDLLQQKWFYIVQSRFWRYFFAVVFFLISLTVSLVYKPVDQAALLPLPTILACLAKQVAHENVSFVGQYCPIPLGTDIPSIYEVSTSFVFMGVVYKSFIEFRELTFDGPIKHFSTHGPELMENILSFMFCLCMWTSYFCYNYELQYAPPFEALASLCAYGYTMYLLIGVKATGPYIMIVFKIIGRDITRFMIIFTFLLFAFAQAFYALFEERGWGNLLKYGGKMFEAMRGELNWEDYVHGDRAWPINYLALVFILTFFILVTTGFFNVLMAAMNQTYEETERNIDSEWRLWRGKMILSFMAGMKQQDIERHSYWSTRHDGKRVWRVITDNTKYANSA